ERHELGVAALCDILQLPQSTVSRHLKILSDQGWLAGRPQGTTRLYRMKAEQDAAARRLWLLSRDQIEAWPTARQDQLRLARQLSRPSPPAAAFFAGAAGRDGAHPAARGPGGRGGPAPPRPRRLPAPDGTAGLRLRA